MKYLFLTILVIFYCFEGFSSDSLKKLRFGVVPFEGGGANLKVRFSPLLDYLSIKLNLEVELITASDYAGIITALSHDHIDCAYLGPKSYVEANKKAQINILGKEINIKGHSGYYGLIITHTKSNITKIEEAKNKTMAFTGPNSTSGYLVPNIYLYRRTPPITPEKFFSRIKFSGSHAASILSIKNKTIDVAATNSVDLRHFVTQGKISKKDFLVLWKSELIPGAVLVCRKKLPMEVQNKFKKAIFNIPEIITKKLGNKGFAQTKDSEYDVIRYMINLKKRLEKK